MKPPLRQIAALPVVDTADGTLVLLITTHSPGRWTIPRGWPKPGVPDAELAAREAFEEAGVEGDIGAEPIGHFLYTKRLHLFSWARCDVDVYKLAVGCQLLDWPEKASRKTKWVGLGEAPSMIRDTGLAGLLRDFARNGPA